MNQKIKMLFEEATYGKTYPNEQYEVTLNKTQLDKFSQLIIQECIGIFQPPKIDDPKWSYDNSMLCQDIQDKIKRHFGIKE